MINNTTKFGIYIYFFLPILYNKLQFHINEYTHTPYQSCGKLQLIILLLNTNNHVFLFINYINNYISIYILKVIHLNFI